MRSLVLLTLILVFSSCSEEVKTVRTEWFDIPDLSNRLIMNMSDAGPSIHKEFIFNGESESRRIDETDSSFWRIELAKLAEINLNSPMVRDYIDLKAASRDNYSNLMVDQYKIDHASKSSIKEVLIYYLDVPSEIRQIHVRFNESNLVFKSETEIDIWLNRYQDLLLIDSLSFSSREKTLLQSKRDYTNKLSVLW